MPEPIEKRPRDPGGGGRTIEPPRMDRFATPMGLNEITETQRARILDYVREGMSLRSIERITGHRRETIARYARRAGLGVRVRPTARPPAAPRRARRDAR